MRAVTSIEKAVDVLFHLHASALPVGVTQLGRAVGLPKSSVHRLLASLMKRDLVQRKGELAEARMLVFGVAMVAIMVLRPRGLVATREPSIYLKEKKKIAAELVAEGRA